MCLHHPASGLTDSAILIMAGASILPTKSLNWHLLSVKPVKKNSLTPKERSVVNKALKNIYTKYGNEHVTMKAMDTELALMPGQEAADIRTYLELFVSGSLNIFAEESNLDISSRFIVFGLKNMGNALRDISMLIMLEYIKERIMYNYSRGVATWLYIDEFAEVLHTSYQRSYLKSFCGCCCVRRAQLLQQ